MQAKAMKLACEVLNGIGTRPSTREWRTRWPEIPRLDPPPYYDQRSDPPRIGFVVVDLGATVKHTIHKSRRLHNRLGELPTFRTLCRGDQCLMVIITGSDGKAEALRVALGDQAFDCPVEVLVNHQLFEYVLQVKR
jgi:hypothetical protein